MLRGRLLCRCDSRRARRRFDERSTACRSRFDDRTAIVTPVEPRGTVLLLPTVPRPRRDRDEREREIDATEWIAVPSRAPDRRNLSRLVSTSILLKDPERSPQSFNTLRNRRCASHANSFALKALTKRANDWQRETCGRKERRYCECRV